VAMTTDSIFYQDMDGKPIESPNKIKIMDISIELFSRKGFTGVSIRDITKEVGIKESSLYNHFRSKEELLSTIFFNFRRSISRILPQEDHLGGMLQSVSPELFLKQSLAGLMKHIDDPVMAKVWRMMYLEQYRDRVVRDIYLNDIVGNMLKSLEKVFAIWIALGRIQPADARILAAEYQYPLFAMIGVYVLLRVDGSSTWDIETGMREHVDYFVSKIIV
jgi:AcrR family transcriptional regulator